MNPQTTIIPFSLLVIALVACRPQAAAEESATHGKPAVGDSYVQVYVDAKTAYNIGEASEIKVTFIPAEGFKINKEYPWKMEIDAPDEIGLTTSKLSKGDLQIASDHEASYKVQFAPTKEGDFESTAKVKLSVCNDKSCKMPKFDLKLPVHVE